MFVGGFAPLTTTKAAVVASIVPCEVQAVGNLLATDGTTHCRYVRTARLPVMPPASWLLRLPLLPHFRFVHVLRCSPRATHSADSRRVVSRLTKSIFVLCHTTGADADFPSPLPSASYSSAHRSNAVSARKLVSTSLLPAAASRSRRGRSRRTLAIATAVARGSASSRTKELEPGDRYSSMPPMPNAATGIPAAIASIFETQNVSGTRLGLNRRSIPSRCRWNLSPCAQPAKCTRLWCGMEGVPQEKNNRGGDGGEGQQAVAIGHCQHIKISDKQPTK